MMKKPSFRESRRKALNAESSLADGINKLRCHHKVAVQTSELVRMAMAEPDEPLTDRDTEAFQSLPEDRRVMLPPSPKSRFDEIATEPIIVDGEVYQLTAEIFHNYPISGPARIRNGYTSKKP